jgi:hypothetical protein
MMGISSEKMQFLNWGMEIEEIIELNEGFYIAMIDYRRRSVGYIPAIYIYVLLIIIVYVND